MKAKELIKILQKYPNREVVISSDSEGNSYETCGGFQICKFNPESREVGLEKLTKEMKAQGYCEEEVMEGGVQAIVLYP